MQPESQFSGGRHDFIANLGYTEDAVSSITINFPERGIYSFDSLSVYGVPMSGFADKISKLQANALQGIVLGTDTVTGTIALENNKLLCLATPFSEGWGARVDGQETEVYCLNKRYPGIVVPSGAHTVQFHYNMPYKRAGLGLSLLGLVGFGAVIILYQKKRKSPK